MKKKALSSLVPARIRKINGSFAFIEHRFLRCGFFESLDRRELLLYFFLILVADRRGMSWYAYDRICGILKLTIDEYIEARNGLIDKDLLAFDGHYFQVLSLPEKAVVSGRRLLKDSDDMERHDPATIRQIISASLGIKEEDRT
jgi:hypothetical protein